MSREEFRQTLSDIRTELKSLRSWREGINSRLDSLEGEITGFKNTGKFLSWVVGVGLAGVAALVAIFK